MSSPTAAEQQPIESVTTSDPQTGPLAQMVPLVYIQTPKSAQTAAVPQLQFATLPPPLATTAAATTTNKTGLILTKSAPAPAPPPPSAPPQLVIHKSGAAAVMPCPKLTGTYLTMLKKTEPQKYVIAPMPKLLKNSRLPVTVTTSTIQPKIAFVPLSIPTNLPENNEKMFNIKISNGQLQTDLDKSIEMNCDEIIDLDSPTKDEKEYELSIVDDDDLISPKLQKHGVSILKKNHETKSINNFRIFNNKSPVTDLDDVKDCIQIETVKSQKPERRRKSNFSYRKDYDDMEIILTNSDDNDVDKYKESFESNDVIVTKIDGNTCDNSPQKAPDFIEIEVIKDAPKDIVDLDLEKLLKWDEGIATLPGSNLKFIMNEYNLLEYVTEEEYKKIYDKKLNKMKKKDELQDEMRCLECGCYGLPSEFINPKYCSYDCQENGKLKELKEKDHKLKTRKKKKAFHKKSAPDLNVVETKCDKETNSNSEDDNNLTSNENSQHERNGTTYPWTNTKNGFSWSKYLDHIKAKAAPYKLFKDPFPYNRNGFRIGMKLEGIDPQHPSYFCVLSVVDVRGYRLCLHFDGYPHNYDFWVNADSIDVFPVGWCEKNHHTLQIPPRYTQESFNWMSYLKLTKTTAAPKHLFANRTGNICPNGFRVGMKLEAVDRKNTALICVATIKDMIDNRILVHFDSWDDIYDYWADPTSPYIHPVGWCDQYGHNLTPPNDYPEPEHFSWEKYLKETKSVAAPVRAFKQRPACGFRKGMRLECVDRRVPRLVRAATVDEVKGHQLRIHFDGWMDRYSYWVDDDSPDIHPVGWCQKTGHPLERPLTAFDIYDFLECPTVGCRGVGHIQGPVFPTHSDQKYCPYSENNVDNERALADRLLSPNSRIETVVPISREPKDKLKPKLGRPPKFTRTETIKIEDDDLIDLKPKKRPKKEDDKLDVVRFVEKSEIEPAELETWSKHSRFLKHFIDKDCDVRGWTCGRVADFISSIPGCESDGYMFELQEIDGESFLLLNQKDLLELFHMKIGPAVKLYNVIVLLRKSCNNDLMYS